MYSSFTAAAGAGSEGNTKQLQANFGYYPVDT